MKVLVSTTETQGQRANDFCYVPEGELVKLTIPCDGETVDGPCGCRRSMTGIDCHLATTTVKVVARDLPEAQYEALLAKSDRAAGWLLAGLPTGAGQLLKLAAAYAVGTILEIRGEIVQNRRPETGSQP